MPVRVLGPVRSGDVLVSSGLHDGLARVTQPGAMPLATRPYSDTRHAFVLHSLRAMSCGAVAGASDDVLLDVCELLSTRLLDTVSKGVSKSIGVAMHTDDKVCHHCSRPAT